MFQESLLSGHDSRRPWTFSVSLLTQLLLVSLAVLLPLLGKPMLPLVSRAFVLLEPPKPPRGAPPPAQTIVVERPQRFDQELRQPQTIPDRAELIVDRAPAEIASGPVVVGADPGGAGAGVIRSIVADVPAVRPPAPPPPKPEAKPAAAVKPITVGGRVQDARILRRVTPAYPPLARQARISGAVLLKAVIAADGTVEQLEVVSGHPLLIQAALTAVQQWRYRPTLLNGQAVPVLTQIEVRFALQ